MTVIKGLRILNTNVIRYSAVGMILVAASTVALATTSFGANAVAPLNTFTSVVVGGQSIDVGSQESSIDLSFTLSPSLDYYPPGADPSQCQLYGTAPCVQFSGTLTDNDTDGSPLFINSFSLILNSGDDAYFSADNFFDSFSGPPGVLEGDTSKSFAPNSYTGLIFGVDIISAPPPGVYNEIAEISACGGTNGDPTCGSFFTVDADFTIQDPAPEPRTGLLMLAGLLGLVGLHRARRSRMSGRPRTSSCIASS
jgi:hypothetical protein